MFKYNILHILLLTMALEYVPGTGKSSLLLYCNYLYYRVAKSPKWICRNPKCNVSLTINAEETEVGRKPAEHKFDECLLNSCQIAVKRAKSTMRTNATDNLAVTAKDVYDGMLKSLTDKGHQLTDISRAGLNSFIRTRKLI